MKVFVTDTMQYFCESISKLVILLDILGHKSTYARKSYDISFCFLWDIANIIVKIVVYGKTILELIGVINVINCYTKWQRKVNIHLNFKYFNNF